MNTEVIEIALLKPDPKNARTHDRKNLDVIKHSLKTFGQRKNVVVDKDNVVIAGNGLLTAALELGLKTLTINRFDMSHDDARAFALVDNRANELSAWDDEILRDTLKALEGINFDVGDIGFNMDDFNFEAPDYSVLGEGEGEQKSLDDMRGEVRKAIQIEFELEHYAEAQALVKFWRDQGAYVGRMLIDHLKKEKETVKL